MIWFYFLATLVMVWIVYILAWVFGWVIASIDALQEARRGRR